LGIPPVGIRKARRGGVLIEVRSGEDEEGKAIGKKNRRDH